MAKLTFDYDPVTGAVTINDADVTKAVGGPIAGAPFVVESRGGGVFHVQCPLGPAPKVAVKAKPK